MTESARTSGSLIRALTDRWRTFWFRPEPAYTLGAVRIAFGALATLWTLSLTPDLDALFSSDGVVAQQPTRPFEWGVFEIWTDDRALIIGWTLLLVSAIALTVGWHSRLAALIVCVLVMSFEFRNPYVFNSGDNLIRVEALILALSPCGTALSLDQRRTTGSFWSAQIRAPWAIRLMQVQLTLIYLATFQSRMTGEKWPDGTAMSYALRLEDMLIIPTPQWISTSALLMNVATWGTLLVELMIGILVWNRRCRPVVLVVGLVLHSIILVTVAVGFFSPAMFVLYLAFVSPEIIRQLPSRLEHWRNRRAATRSEQPTERVAT
ncbi:HTTM domain-containing protein [Mycobacterium sp.]|uniref:HTTM domain-containing protein n=1 Tax=Mycobacterium sp. TaxID=1785 RepID=UPI002D8A9ABD|nr:HTTM domain-containing protein [Mycobacterium sp.]